MAKRLYVVLLLSVVLSGSAFAQISGTAGGSLANPYGAVTLPGITTPSGVAAGSNGPPAGTSVAGGSGGAVSAPPATSASSSPGQSRSNGSSATGATAGSNSVPAWLLCPPSGASGLAPFLTGTNLSCAP
jgi:hypothetical protein